MTSMPCDRCVGRSLNVSKPLDDAGLQTMLSLGGIRHWKKHEIIFHCSDTAWELTQSCGNFSQSLASNPN